jgi:peptide/nickel transport system permease protein
MAQRFPITIHIGLTAFIFGNIAGIILGAIAALRRGTWVDATATIFSYIGITIPVFWLGLLLMYVFGLKLGWLPISGLCPATQDFWLSTKKHRHPVACEMITGLAVIMRKHDRVCLRSAGRTNIRTSMVQRVEGTVHRHQHMMKNSLIPVVTLLGMGIGIIFGGSVLVETVFAIPGVGRLLVTSVFQQDYVVVQSGALVYIFNRYFEQSAC